MKRNMIVGLLSIALAAVLLAGCGGSVAPEAAEAPPEPTEATAEDAAPIAEGIRRFVVVPEESSAAYVVDEEFFADALTKFNIPVGRVDTVGTTREIEGELQLDLSDPSSFAPSRFTVNIESLSSDQSMRDRWIRNNALESSTYPLAEFVANAIEDAPEAYVEGEEATFKLLGDMTIREITRPVSFDVTATLDGDTARGVATATMIMSDFGVEPPNFANTLTVADEFQVQIEFTAREE